MANRKKSSKDAKASAEDVSAEEKNEKIDSNKAEAAGDAPLTETGGTDTAKDGPQTDDDKGSPLKLGPSDELQRDDDGDGTEGDDATSIPDEDQDIEKAADSDAADTNTDRDDQEHEADETPYILQNPPAGQPEQVVIRKGGFVPMLLGGLVAGAVGFGASQYLVPDSGHNDQALADTLSQLEDQATTINTLGEQVEALSAGPDLGEFVAAQEAQQAAIENVANRLLDLEGSLAEIAALPTGEGLSDTALVAYDRALKSLQASLDEQRAMINEISDEAVLQEKHAQSAAMETLQRAALTRIQTALDSGAGFAPALADLEETGADVPQALIDVADEGVPSLAELLEVLPDASREALRVSRLETSGSGETGGVSAFLRKQLGARSLEPREGADPDAVLSRVEAAAREARLTDALAEIEGLPEAGRAELSYWSGQVTRRQDALAAVQELSEKLN